MTATVDYGEAYAVANVPLSSLVHHCHVVADSDRLEQVFERFRELEVDFMAVRQRDRVIGLMGRSRLGLLMGSRFGFSLYSHSESRKFMLPHPLIVREDAPVHALLDQAFSRQGDAFYEDVVLVREDGDLVGLINVETLARLQTRLVSEQVSTLRQQHEALHEQNLELFRTNHALRQSQGLYQGLFRSEALGVALLSPEGRVELHNPRFVELTGVQEEGEGRRSLLDRMNGREREDFARMLRGYAADEAGVESTREVTLQVPGRRARVFRVTTGWIRETSQVCACFDDVTEQRALEQMMVRQEKQHLLDTLVGGIAHELNNKLTPVLAFAEILVREVAGRHLTHAESIRSSAEEAAKIIRQLLQFSRPVEAEQSMVDMRQVVRDGVDILEVSTRDCCELQILLPEQPVWVMGDAGQLKQVLMNLVLNACHAVEKCACPRITVKVSSEHEVAELAVVDNGRGIAPEVLPRVFDPFFTTKGPDKGSGLGLSICYSIARQHGGEIAVESEVGEGTQFVLTLPRQNPATVLLRGDGGVPRLFADADVPERRRRVLVVEDEQVLRGVLREMLRSQFGSEIDMAENGREGVEAVMARSYDLVLSDIRMPEMNGLEFYQRVREVRPDQATRFAFVTGYAGAVDGMVMPSGVPVLGKPFSLRQFEDLCGPYLRATEVSALSD
ncbi:ATP-binding protein [Actomonas aquatica]|uniref:histidine kinase n=1 Tax=Actomonas aquatica TaxID=2866162 RepID=A0ABZ1C4M7_9BACT|nr:ATP-binding protein [Opitutus sp. WL0086]WRQ86683.1 ATP-binding protein [Opitutus sp. WL0086]